MPVYEFACDGCYEIAKELLGVNDPHPERCGCGGRLSKIMSTIQKPKMPYSGDLDDGSDWEESELKNKAWLESPEIAAQIRSGEREMKIPTHMPARFQPKI